MDETELARELDEQDKAARRALDGVEELIRASAELASDETRTRGFLERFEDERALRLQAIAIAEDELAHARQEDEQAQAALAEAERKRDADRRAGAERAAHHATTTARIATEHVQRLHVRLAALVDEYYEALSARAELLEVARALADELHSTPRLEARELGALDSEQDVAAWASAARAALLVARSGLAAECEGLLRQRAELDAHKNL
jgi:hypothetical protein